MARGWFIALEGVDGVGKSTQIRQLADWLTRDGHAVVTCRDPGSTELGESVRDLLLHSSLDMDRRSEMLLYMAARAQLVAEVIRPSMEAGKIVLSDRFLLSNVVYQAYAGGLAVDDVWTVGRVATGGLLPDLTFVLDLDADLATRRRGREADRMERQGPAYLAQVRQGFLDAAGNAAHPAAITVVDAADSADTIHARIRSHVRQLLQPGTNT